MKPARFKQLVQSIEQAKAIRAGTLQPSRHTRVAAPPLPSGGTSGEIQTDMPNDNDRQAAYERQFRMVSQLSAAVRDFQREFPRAEVSGPLNRALDAAAVELHQEYERLRQRHNPPVT